MRRALLPLAKRACTRQTAGCLVVLGWLSVATTAVSTCGMSGDKCSMPRDCCEAHECAEGDWAVSSDYACQRIGQKPTRDAYVERLRAFYAQHNPEKLRGSNLALDNTLTKWEGREERLFHVLKGKYGRGHDEL